MSAQREPTRLDCPGRPPFDRYTAVRRRMFHEHSPKIVATQRWISYSVTAGRSKTEIPVKPSNAAREVGSFRYAASRLKCQTSAG